MSRIITPAENELPQAALRAGRKSDALNLLLNDPGALNRFDMFQQTPLHIAAEKGFDDMVALFLQRGAKANPADKNNWTPLHRYENSVQFTDVERLTYSLSSPSACAKAHWRSAKLLLENGANPTLLTMEGTSALHYIVRHAWVQKELCNEVLTLMVEKGADVNAQNLHMDTPLHHANLRVGIAESITFLVQHGANINLPNGYEYLQKFSNFCQSN